MNLAKRYMPLTSISGTGKDTRAHQSSRLLPELERMLDWTLDYRQGFACAATTKPNLCKCRTTSRVCYLSIGTYVP
jgi:hypothetical protein